MHYFGHKWKNEAAAPKKEEKDTQLFPPAYYEHKKRAEAMIQKLHTPPAHAKHL